MQIVTCPDGEEIQIISKNRFSKFVSTKDSPNYAILEGWVERFKAQGINACLVKANGGGYAVYRNGLVNQEFTKREMRKTVFG